jgi:WD40-like Beta Propeller Repeat
MTTRSAPFLSRRFLQLVSLIAAIGAVAPAWAGAAPYAFQPIAIQRINLPSTVKSAGWPVFTPNGQHLLFYSTGANTPGGSTGPGSTAELWITSVHGGHAHCLSCGLANDPTSQGEGEITPFPDGKRVFFGSFFQPGSSAYGVLECTPSVANCKRVLGYQNRQHRDDGHRDAHAIELRVHGHRPPRHQPGNPHVDL